MKLFFRLAIVVLFIALIAAFFALDGGRYLSLDYVKAQQAAFAAYYAAHNMQTPALFFIAYVAVTAFSIPGATVLTLLAGALFGAWAGTLVVSFASTVGATLAFLGARLLLREYIQKKYGHRLRAVNEGFEKDGAFYLLTLRLLPIFPFFLVNVLMALAPIRAGMFYIVSQIGMLPATILYVYAGTRLASIASTRDILSPSLIGVFLLLGLFPWFAKTMIGWVKAHRVMRGYKKPARFDYNLVVIGGGSAGLVSSYIAATVKAKVALIEKHRMGGDCLNTGCVPSKALIRSARIVSYMKRAAEFGLKPVDPQLDFAEVMARVRRVISAIAPHDSVERYSGLGVECISGEAQIRDPYRVEVNGRILTTRAIIIATGAKPLVPPIPGLGDIPYLTSDTIWEMNALPKRLLVLGGGPIGAEMAQAFARLGSQVTLVEMAPQILTREDEEVIALMKQTFNREGIEIHTGYKAKAIKKQGEETQLLCETAAGEVGLPFDRILVALGRKANVNGFGLEALGVAIRPQGTIHADGFLRTNIPNIYVCGDVTGPYQFTHVAAHQAWYASVNALFAPFKRFKADYRVVPWVTFTDPEVARVGLNEQEAKEQNIPYEVTTYGIDDLDRAIAEEEAHGFVKVLTAPGKDRILGVAIVGDHAGDLLAEFVLAMQCGIGLNQILGTIHSYPTLAEANKYAAGNWRRAHAPAVALRLLSRFHAWRR